MLQMFSCAHVFVCLFAGVFAFVMRSQRVVDWHNLGGVDSCPFREWDVGLQLHVEQVTHCCLHQLFGIFYWQSLSFTSGNNHPQLFCERLSNPVAP